MVLNFIEMKSSFTVKSFKRNKMQINRTHNVFSVFLFHGFKEIKMMTSSNVICKHSFAQKVFTQYLLTSTVLYNLSWPVQCQNIIL